PASGKQHRIVGVDVLSREAVLHHVKACLAVGMIKRATIEQPWCARVGVVWARPEDALLLFDLLVGNAVIVTQSTPRYPPQLTKDVFNAGIGKLLPGRKASGQVADDLPVRTRLSRRLHCLPDADDAAFGRGHGAFVFLLQRAR